MPPFDLDKFRLDVLSDPLVQDIWTNKYRFGNEESILDSQIRVIDAIMGEEAADIYQEAAFMIRNGYFLPAGRQNAGAGTGRNVTLQNCYVGDTIQDSMPGIQLAIAKSAFTLQQGGGIGNDFSTVRPAGALVKRTGSVSSGSIAFMNQMSTMSDTVCSAGERRGAMMTTLADWHVDLWRPDQFETTKNYTGDDVMLNPSFISVKRQKGKLTQTNISVLISDAFMTAVETDADWDLGFWTPRANGNHVDVYNKPFPYNYVEIDNDFHESFLEEDIQGRHKGEMLPFYVYTRVKARRIWNDIMQSTYKYAEPGVIFIDRMNQRNNLQYCEDIRCTNPCGEQNLPPNGTCCLGSINVAFMVKNPFTPQAQFDIDLYRRAIHVGVRFLDNVLDISNYPLKEQRDESMAKRRIGLGITGVADALLQLEQTYGSGPSLLTAQSMGIILQQESYMASSLLAKERGPFLAYDRDRFQQSPNVQRLPESTKKHIYDYGIRNGVLNTVAPNGTISIYSGNTAQGIEPVFSFLPVTRKVRQPDGSLTEFTSRNYSHRLWMALHPDKIRGYQDEYLPDYFVGAMDITPTAHIQMQAAFQESIDASISKTVNCPTEMSFDAFRGVYELAYQIGCKGCTTYRYDPDSGRGSVLSVNDTNPVMSINVDGHEIPITIQEAASLIIGESTESLADIRHYTTESPLPKSDMPISTNDVGQSQQVFTEDITEWSTMKFHDHEPPEKTPIHKLEVKPAQRVVEARRYKLRWPLPPPGSNWYITITRHNGEPFEVFITTSAAGSSEWVQALSRLLTAILRRGGDVRFLVNELAEVHSALGGAFIKEQKTWRPSIIAAIGGVLEEEFKALGLIDTFNIPTDDGGVTEEILDAFNEAGNVQNKEAKVVPVTVTFGAPGPDTCPDCGATPLAHEEGCKRCLNCPWSSCG